MRFPPQVCGGTVAWRKPAKDVRNPPCRSKPRSSASRTSPLTIETIELDDPPPREVLVRTVATGVCHSDLHVVDGVGRWPLDRPIVLGHEGAGIVEAVGPR